MLEAIIIYSLAVHAPTGYVRINSDICKKAYGMDLDGKLTHYGKTVIKVKGYCYKKDISNG